MLTNIRGLVERLQLAPGRGMLPLFEAISNSMDAIADRPLGAVPGVIRVRLVAAEDLLTQTEDAFVVGGFEITDNGVGLDDAHMAAFREAYTLSKVNVGGKGVGRFTFLKVFADVRVRSIFQRDGQRFMRGFQFAIDADITGGDDLEVTTKECGSVIVMKGVAERYRSAWPADPALVAQRILEHFLIRFVSRNCPTVILECPGHADIDLKKVFDATIAPHIEERTFEVSCHQFSLQAFRKRNDGRGRHEYHLCATGREVATEKLKELLPELPERFVGQDQEPYTLIVLLTGEYLDAHANPERTNIAFQSSTEMDFDQTLISRQSLNKGITETLRQVLASDLKTTHEEKIAQIERFVVEAPEYRVLTHEKYRPLIEQRVPAGLKDEQLDEVLLHLRREVEDGVRKEERHVAALMEVETFDQYQEKMRALMESMNEVGKSKLADYVAHRRTILDLVDKSLKRVQLDGKYPFERVLHKMIFPMGASSKDVFFDQQNLWLIDERLCFHTLLTSDKKLNKVAGLQDTSGKEPDILGFFYDTPIGLAEPDNLAGGCVVVVEFKRPGRDDYDRDPADQIIQRFVEIKTGSVKDIEGRPINSERLRYTGYLIADLTPSLRRQVQMRYHKTMDNEGYFMTLPDGDGYLEIISYDKLLRDAQRRNRVLFEKLGIHKH